MYTRLIVRTVCIHVDRKDCVYIRMIVRTVCVYTFDRKDCVCIHV